MLAVKLDDARFGAGPGTVIATVATCAEYEALISDRDGARDPRMRLWAGDATIGARVVMKQLICGTGKGIFTEAPDGG